MTLKEFARDNPNRKLILLWFGQDEEELHSNYCYSQELSDGTVEKVGDWKLINSMGDWEVMETDSYDEEDWIEVWLKKD